MKLLNLSIENTSQNRNNHKLLPRNIRGCIIGKSGSGKTNLLMNLLLQNYLDYNCLYIFSKSLHQPIYQILINGFKNNLSKEEILKCILTKNFSIVENSVGNSIKIFAYNDSKDLPDPNELDSNNKNLIIFDDLIDEKNQTKMESYYSRGRHNNTDVFYISQNYIKLPKNTIRENTNFYIIFPQDHQNINYIFKDHCSDKINKNTFENLCKDSWQIDYGFLTIDKTSTDKRFRKQLDEVLIFEGSGLGLKDLYYNPKTGYCGINELQRKSGKPTKEIKEFLNQQDTYTLHKPTKKNFKRKEFIFIVLMNNSKQI